MRILELIENEFLPGVRELVGGVDGVSITELEIDFDLSGKGAKEWICVNMFV